MNNVTEFNPPEQNPESKDEDEKLFQDTSHLDQDRDMPGLEIHGKHQDGKEKNESGENLGELL